MREFLSQQVWLVPFFPLLGALVNAVLAWSGIRKRSFVSLVACGSLLLSFLLSLTLFFYLKETAPADRVFVSSLGLWLDFEHFQLPISFLVDPLSILLMLVITGVGFLIHLYSVGYMAHEEGDARYFAYLNLFCFMMLCLVMGSNLLLMFFGWEGVGFCSYGLIGFWFADRKNSAAGMKAFIVNRIGDFGMISGILLLFWMLVSMGEDSLDFIRLREFAEVLGQKTVWGFPLLTVVCLFLFLGACGKSAQIPLYVWLPDAMAGPTPVSALIHAATMVTAGVYMIARLSFLFSLAPGALEVVAVTGFVTAAFAAIIAFAQNDIKKVLAYSTVSQLGYMFGAMGVAAYTAGIFHLITHAFFKACLFLGSGSVIHALGGEQDMRKMGGLKKYIPLTYVTFFVATLAIAGIFPFAGFFSKDEILWHAFHQNPALWGLGLLTAMGTAVYMFRLLTMTFFGTYQPAQHGDPHLPHESPWTMTVPLVLLALLSLLSGMIGVPEALGHLVGWHQSHWLQEWLAPVLVFPTEPIVLSSHTLEYVLMVLSLSFAVGGSISGYVLYAKRKDLPLAFVQKWPLLYRVVSRRFYVDEIYEAVFVIPCLITSRFVAAWDRYVVDGVVNLVGRLSKTGARLSGALDHYVVDGAVNLVAYLLSWMGSILRVVQTGKIQTYVYMLLFVLTVFVVAHLS